MVETCLPIDEVEALNSNEISSEKCKRSDSHQSEVAQKNKSLTHGGDRTSSRAFSEKMDETSRSRSSFIHLE